MTNFETSMSGWLDPRLSGSGGLTGAAVGAAANTPPGLHPHDNADSPFAAILGERMNSTSAADQSRLADIRTFSQSLARPDADPKASAAQRAREGAEQLVAAAFLTPLLKDFRESTWAEGPFKATRGERMFRSIGDAEVARKMVQRGDWPLVDAVARRLLANTPGVETPGGPTGDTKPASTKDSRATDGERPEAESTGDPTLDGRIALDRARDAARGFDFRVPRPADADR